MTLNTKAAFTATTENLDAITQRMLEQSDSYGDKDKAEFSDFMNAMAIFWQHARQYHEIDAEHDDIVINVNHASLSPKEFEEVLKAGFHLCPDLNEGGPAFFRKLF
jgi:hypothetical protein